MIKVRRKMMFNLQLKKTCWIFTIACNNQFSEGSSLKGASHIVIRDWFCSHQGWKISISEMAAWWQVQKRIRNKSTHSLFQSLFIWCLLLMPLCLKALHFWHRTSGWRLRAGRFKKQLFWSLFWLSIHTFALLRESSASLLEDFPWMGE